MPDTLESMFLGQSILLQQCIQGSKGSTAPLQDRTESLRHALHALARSGELDSENATFQEVASPFEGLSQKRKAECDPGNPPRRAHRPSTPDVLDSGPLPETIHCALLAYFRIVHPWVPVLHPATFTKRATDTKRSSEVNMLLRAIIACSFRYLTEAEITDVADLPAMASTCREKAMAAAVSDTTIQSLQALLLLIFDSVSPWPDLLGGDSPLTLLGYSSARQKHRRLGHLCLSLLGRWSNCSYTLKDRCLST